MPGETHQPSGSLPEEFRWGHAELAVRFRIAADGAVGIAGLEAPRLEGRPSAWFDGGTDAEALPLVEVQVAGSGRDWSGERGIATAAGARLRYQGHEVGRDGDWLWLRVDLADPASGLAVQAHYRTPEDAGVVQSWAVLTNSGKGPVALEAVSSFVLAGTVGGPDDADDKLAGLDVLWADNDWLAEGRWQRERLRDLLVDVNRAAHQHDPRSCFARTSQGSWSSGRHLPTGALVRSGGGALLWQIESSGGWRWEVGDHAGKAYVAMFGPTDRDHQWRRILAPGETFTTIPAAIALGAPRGVEDGDGLTEAIAAMTRYRRKLRRPHQDLTELPVIYNDYMNTLMGDPTTERLLPLIDAAAEVGAEYFVIDAGWYDDDAGGWWDSVGAWREAPSRFPGGLAEVLDHVRTAGMTPGLWLEPEVIGVRSTVADQLPADAFFQRDGIRVVEHGRYHLDLRHPAAVKHLDEVVDRLVTDYCVGYLKLDYNINPGPGTDLGGSAGAGLLDHQRAYTAWLDAILDRHPHLVLENCASGGMRSDYALLARAQLQSTSDQQDFLRYPPIAAAAPAAITPEQAAVWAYPQPEFTTDEIAFTLCGALLGRIHLSGHLNRMGPAKRALVADAIAVYKRIRSDIPTATPFWPLGLPGWNDPWLALGLRAADVSYVVVWHREDAADASRTLLVPHLRGTNVVPHVIYPEDTADEVSWDADRGELTLRLPRTVTACLIALPA